MSDADQYAVGYRYGCGYKTPAPEQVAEVLQMDLEQVRALNPQYKRDIIPGNAAPCVLKLPVNQTYAFIDKEDTIYTHRAEDLLENCLAYNPNGADEGKSSNREKITHRVASGENIYTISDRYGVTPKEVRQWNGLKSNRLASGRRLTLYVDNGEWLSLPLRNRKLYRKELHRLKLLRNKVMALSLIRSNREIRCIRSLKKYPGVSAALIQKANGLSNANIRPGQVLKIPVG